jgi:hypothetical protein
VELNPRPGDSLMVIKADGRWFHDGGNQTTGDDPRLAGLLRRDERSALLVTPHEQQAIVVEGAPHRCRCVARCPRLPAQYR